MDYRPGLRATLFFFSFLNINFFRKASGLNFDQKQVGNAGLVEFSSLAGEGGEYQVAEKSEISTKIGNVN